MHSALWQFSTLSTSRLGVGVHAAAAATSKKSSGVSGYVILVILVLGALVLFNARRRAGSVQRRQQTAVTPGAAVVTRSGMLGTVVEVTEDSVLLEIAPGVTAKFVPQAIGQVLTPGPEDMSSRPGTLDGSHEALDASDGPPEEGLEHGSETETGKDAPGGDAPAS